MAYNQLYKPFEYHLDITHTANRGEFTIKTNQEMEAVISNVAGHAVRSISLNRKNGFQALVNDLKPGIYFISDKTHKALKQKIVVTRDTEAG